VILLGHAGNQLDYGKNELADSSPSVYFGTDRANYVPLLEEVKARIA
jgi:hypothetical protein